jgi:hypothetical protein
MPWAKIASSRHDHDHITRKDNNRSSEKQAISPECGKLLCKTKGKTIQGRTIILKG